MSESEKEKEEIKLEDEVHSTAGPGRTLRRKVASGLRRIRDWFNKNLKSGESLPEEFESLVPKQPQTKDKVRDIWNRFL